MHRALRPLTVANVAAAALAAACFTATGSAAPPPPRSAAHTARPEQAAAPRASRVHGMAIEHLPANCQTLAYADIGAIAATDPVEQNRELLRERARMMLERDPSLAASVHKTLDALSSHGIDWKKDLDEVAVCTAGDRIESMTLAGAFEGKDLVGALVAGAPDAGPSSITSVEQGGRTYAVIDHFYAAQVTPSVLAIAKDIATVDASRERGPGLVERGGQGSDLALFRAVRPNGQLVVSRVEPRPSDLVVETTIHAPTGPFDAAREEGVLEEEVAKLANELRATPLAATADAVKRTTVTVHGDEARLRTELPKKQVRQAIAAAAVSHRDDWVAILPRRGAAMGGGPQKQR